MKDNFNPSHKANFDNSSIDDASLNDFREQVSEEQRVENKSLIPLCVGCKEPFKKEHGNQNYCSQACRVVSRKRKRYCANCGDTVKTSDGTAKRGRRAYCNDECMKDAKLHRGRCKFCDKPFKSAHGNTKYCDVLCRTRFIETTRKKNVVRKCGYCSKEVVNRKFCNSDCRAMAYKPPEMQKKCKYCQDEFTTRNKLKVYCSYRCRAYNAEKQNSEKTKIIKHD